MKKVYFLAVCAAFSAAAVSCVNEEIGSPEEGLVEKIFTGYIDDSDDTRTTLNQNFDIVWPYYCFRRRRRWKEIH